MEAFRHVVKAAQSSASAHLDIDVRDHATASSASWAASGTFALTFWIMPNNIGASDLVSLVHTTDNSARDLRVGLGTDEGGAPRVVFTASSGASVAVSVDRPTTQTHWTFVGLQFLNGTEVRHYWGRTKYPGAWDGGEGIDAAGGWAVVETTLPNGTPVGVGLSHIRLGANCRLADLRVYDDTTRLDTIVGPPFTASFAPSSGLVGAIGTASQYIAEHTLAQPSFPDIMRTTWFPNTNYPNTPTAVTRRNYPKGAPTTAWPPSSALVDLAAPVGARLVRYAQSSDSDPLTIDVRNGAGDPASWASSGTFALTFWFLPTATSASIPLLELVDMYGATLSTVRVSRPLMGTTRKYAVEHNDDHLGWSKTSSLAWDWFGEDDDGRWWVFVGVNYKYSGNSAVKLYFGRTRDPGALNGDHTSEDGEWYVVEKANTNPTALAAHFGADLATIKFGPACRVVDLRVYEPVVGGDGNILDSVFGPDFATASEYTEDGITYNTYKTIPTVVNGSVLDDMVPEAFPDLMRATWLATSTRPRGAPDTWPSFDATVIQQHALRRGYTRTDSGEVVATAHPTGVYVHAGDVTLPDVDSVLQAEAYANLAYDGDESLVLVRYGLQVISSFPATEVTFPTISGGSAVWDGGDQTTATFAVSRTVAPYSMVPVGAEVSDTAAIVSYETGATATVDTIRYQPPWSAPLRVSSAGKGSSGQTMLSVGDTTLYAYSGTPLQLADDGINVDVTGDGAGASSPLVVTSTNKNHSTVARQTINVLHTGVYSIVLRVSSELNYDDARFYIDDVLDDASKKPEGSGGSASGLSGDQWDNPPALSTTRSLNAGQTVRFEYDKDGSVSNYDDTARLEMYLTGDYGHHLTHFHSDRSSRGGPVHYGDEDADAMKSYLEGTVKVGDLIVVAVHYTATAHTAVANYLSEHFGATQFDGHSDDSYILVGVKGSDTPILEERRDDGPLDFGDGANMWIRYMHASGLTDRVYLSIANPPPQSLFPQSGWSSAVVDGAQMISDHVRVKDDHLYVITGTTTLTERGVCALVSTNYTPLAWFTISAIHIGSNNELTLTDDRDADLGVLASYPREGASIVVRATNVGQDQYSSSTMSISTTVITFPDALSLDQTNWLNGGSDAQTVVVGVGGYDTAAFDVERNGGVVTTSFDVLLEHAVSHDTSYAIGDLTVVHKASELTRDYSDLTVSLRVDTTAPILNWNANKLENGQADISDHARLRTDENDTITLYLRDGGTFPNITPYLVASDDQSGVVTAITVQVRNADGNTIDSNDIGTAWHTIVAQATDVVGNTGTLDISPTVVTFPDSLACTVTGADGVITVTVALDEGFQLSGDNPTMFTYASDDPRGDQTVSKEVTHGASGMTQDVDVAFTLAQAATVSFNATIATDDDIRRSGEGGTLYVRVGTDVAGLASVLATINNRDTNVPPTVALFKQTSVAQNTTVITSDTTLLEVTATDVYGVETKETIDVSPVFGFTAEPSIANWVDFSTAVSVSDVPDGAYECTPTVAFDSSLFGDNETMITPRATNYGFDHNGTASSFEFYFNATASGHPETAITYFGGGGGLFLQKWGTDNFGTSTDQFAVASRFGEDIHVVFVDHGNNTKMYLNGEPKGYATDAYVVGNKLYMMRNGRGSYFGEGSILYGWKTYGEQLTDTQVEERYDEVRQGRTLFDYNNSALSLSSASSVPPHGSLVKIAVRIKHTASQLVRFVTLSANAVTFPTELDASDVSGSIDALTVTVDLDEGFQLSGDNSTSFTYDASTANREEQLTVSKAVTHGAGMMTKNVVVKFTLAPAATVSFNATIDTDDDIRRSDGGTLYVRVGTNATGLASVATIGHGGQPAFDPSTVESTTTELHVSATDVYGVVTTETIGLTAVTFPTELAGTVTGANGTLTVTVALDEGFQLSGDNPFTYASDDPRGGQTVSKEVTHGASGMTQDVDVAFTLAQAATVSFNATIETDDIRRSDGGTLYVRVGTDVAGLASVLATINNANVPPTVALFKQTSVQNTTVITSDTTELEVTATDVYGVETKGTIGLTAVTFPTELAGTVTGANGTLTVTVALDEGFQLSGDNPFTYASDDPRGGQTVSKEVTHGASSGMTKNVNVTFTLAQAATVSFNATIETDDIRRSDGGTLYVRVGTDDAGLASVATIEHGGQPAFDPSPVESTTTELRVSATDVYGVVTTETIGLTAVSFPASLSTNPTNWLSTTVSNATFDVSEYDGYTLTGATGATSATVNDGVLTIQDSSNSLSHGSTTTVDLVLRHNDSGLTRTYNDVGVTFSVDRNPPSIGWSDSVIDIDISDHARLRTDENDTKTLYLRDGGTFPPDIIITYLAASDDQSGVDTAGITVQVQNVDGYPIDSNDIGTDWHAIVAQATDVADNTGTLNISPTLVTFPTSLSTNSTNWLSTTESDATFTVSGYDGRILEWSEISAWPLALSTNATGATVNDGVLTIQDSSYSLSHDSTATVGLVLTHNDSGLTRTYNDVGVTFRVDRVPPSIDWFHDDSVSVVEVLDDQNGVVIARVVASDGGARQLYVREGALLTQANVEGLVTVDDDGASGLESPAIELTIADATGNSIDSLETLCGTARSDASIITLTATDKAGNTTSFTVPTWVVEVTHTDVPTVDTATPIGAWVGGTVAVVPDLFDEYSVVSKSTTVTADPNDPNTAAADAIAAALELVADANGTVSLAVGSSSSQFGLLTGGTTGGRIGVVATVEVRNSDPTTFATKTVVYSFPMDVDRKAPVASWDATATDVALPSPNADPSVSDDIAAGGVVRRLVVGSGVLYVRRGHVFDVAAAVAVSDGTAVYASGVASWTLVVVRTNGGGAEETIGALSDGRYRFEDAGSYEVRVSATDAASNQGSPALPLVVVDPRINDMGIWAGTDDRSAPVPVLDDATNAWSTSAVASAFAGLDGEVEVADATTAASEADSAVASFAITVAHGSGVSRIYARSVRKFQAQPTVSRVAPAGGTGLPLDAQYVVVSHDDGDGLTVALAHDTPLAVRDLFVLAGTGAGAVSYTRGDAEPATIAAATPLSDGSVFADQAQSVTAAVPLLPSSVVPTPASASVDWRVRRATIPAFGDLFNGTHRTHWYENEDRIYRRTDESGAVVFSVSDAAQHATGDTVDRTLSFVYDDVPLAVTVATTVHRAPTAPPSPSPLYYGAVSAHFRAYQAAPASGEYTLAVATGLGDPPYDPQTELAPGSYTFTYELQKAHASLPDRSSDVVVYNDVAVRPAWTDAVGVDVVVPENVPENEPVLVDMRTYLAYPPGVATTMALDDIDPLSVALVYDDATKTIGLEGGGGLDHENTSSITFTATAMQGGQAGEEQEFTLTVGDEPELGHPAVFWAPGPVNLWAAKGANPGLLLATVHGLGDGVTDVSVGYGDAMALHGDGATRVLRLRTDKPQAELIAALAPDVAAPTDLGTLTVEVTVTITYASANVWTETQTLDFAYDRRTPSFALGAEVRAYVRDMGETVSFRLHELSPTLSAAVRDWGGSGLRVRLSSSNDPPHDFFDTETTYGFATTIDGHTVASHNSDAYGSWTASPDRLHVVFVNADDHELVSDEVELARIYWRARVTIAPRVLRESDGAGALADRATMPPGLGGFVYGAALASADPEYDIDIDDLSSSTNIEVYRWRTARDILYAHGAVRYDADATYWAAWDAVDGLPPGDYSFEVVAYDRFVRWLGVYVPALDGEGTHTPRSAALDMDEGAYTQRTAWIPVTLRALPTLIATGADVSYDEVDRIVTPAYSDAAYGDVGQRTAGTTPVASIFLPMVATLGGAAVVVDGTPTSAVQYAYSPDEFVQSDALRGYVHHDGAAAPFVGAPFDGSVTVTVHDDAFTMDTGGASSVSLTRNVALGFDVYDTTPPTIEIVGLADGGGARVVIADLTAYFIRSAHAALAYGDSEPDWFIVGGVGDGDRFQIDVADDPTRTHSLVTTDTTLGLDTTYTVQLDTEAPPGYTDSAVWATRRKATVSVRVVAEPLGVSFRAHGDGDAVRTRRPLETTDPTTYAIARFEQGGAGGGGGGLGGLDEAPSPDEYAATRVAVYNADDSGVVYALEGGHEADVTGSGTAADPFLVGPTTAGHWNEVFATFRVVVGGDVDWQIDATAHAEDVAVIGSTADAVWASTSDVARSGTRAVTAGEYVVFKFSQNALHESSPHTGGSLELKPSDGSAATLRRASTEGLVRMDGPTLRFVGNPCVGRVLPQMHARLANGMLNERFVPFTVRAESGVYLDLWSGGCAHSGTNNTITFTGGAWVADGFDMQSATGGLQLTGSRSSYDPTDTSLYDVHIEYDQAIDGYYIHNIDRRNANGDNYYHSDPSFGFPGTEGDTFHLTDYYHHTVPGVVESTALGGIFFGTPRTFDEGARVVSVARRGTISDAHSPTEWKVPGEDTLYDGSLLLGVHLDRADQSCVVHPMDLVANALYVLEGQLLAGLGVAGAPAGGGWVRVFERDAWPFQRLDDERGVWAITTAPSEMLGAFSSTTALATASVGPSATDAQALDVEFIAPASGRVVVVLAAYDGGASVASEGFRVRDLRIQQLSHWLGDTQYVAVGGPTDYIAYRAQVSETALYHAVPPGASRPASNAVWVASGALTASPWVDGGGQAIPAGALVGGGLYRLLGEARAVATPVTTQGPVGFAPLALGSDALYVAVTGDGAGPSSPLVVTSTNTTHNSVATQTIDVQFAGTYSVVLRVSSELYYDDARFYIDDVLDDASKKPEGSYGSASGLSGDQWEPPALSTTRYLGAGQTVKFQYDKDVSESKNYDKAQLEMYLLDALDIDRSGVVHMEYAGLGTADDPLVVENTNRNTQYGSSSSARSDYASSTASLKITIRIAGTYVVTGKVDSEYSYDFGRVLVNNIIVASMSGYDGGTNEGRPNPPSADYLPADYWDNPTYDAEVALAVGDTVEFRYVKDSSWSMGIDGARFTFHRKDATVPSATPAVAPVVVVDEASEDELAHGLSDAPLTTAWSAFQSAVFEAPPGGHVRLRLPAIGCMVRNVRLVRRALGDGGAYEAYNPRTLTVQTRVRHDAEAEALVLALPSPDDPWNGVQGGQGAPAYVAVGTTYHEPGVPSSDGRLVLATYPADWSDGPPVLDTAGTLTLTYEAHDRAGNVASAARAVVVRARPTIAVTSPIHVAVGSTIPTSLWPVATKGVAADAEEPSLVLQPWGTNSYVAASPETWTTPTAAETIVRWRAVDQHGLSSPWGYQTVQTRARPSPPALVGGLVAWYVGQEGALDLMGLVQHSDETATLSIAYVSRDDGDDVALVDANGTAGGAAATYVPADDHPVLYTVGFVATDTYGVSSTAVEVRVPYRQRPSIVVEESVVRVVSDTQGQSSVNLHAGVRIVDYPADDSVAHVFDPATSLEPYNAVDRSVVGTTTGVTIASGPLPASQDPTIRPLVGLYDVESVTISVEVRPQVIATTAVVPIREDPTGAAGEERWAIDLMQFRYSSGDGTWGWGESDAAEGLSLGSDGKALVFGAPRDYETATDAQRSRTAQLVYTENDVVSDPVTIQVVLVGVQEGPEFPTASVSLATTLNTWEAETPTDVFTLGVGDVPSATDPEGDDVTYALLTATPHFDYFDLNGSTVRYVGPTGPEHVASATLRIEARTADHARTDVLAVYVPVVSDATAPALAMVDDATHEQHAAAATVAFPIADYGDSPSGPPDAGAYTATVLYEGGAAATSLSLTVSAPETSQRTAADLPVSAWPNGLHRITVTATTRAGGASTRAWSVRILPRFPPDLSGFAGDLAGPLDATARTPDDAAIALPLPLPHPYATDDARVAAELVAGLVGGQDGARFHLTDVDTLDPVAQLDRFRAFSLPADAGRLRLVAGLAHTIDITSEPTARLVDAAADPLTGQTVEHVVAAPGVPYDADSYVLAYGYAPRDHPEQVTETGHVVVARSAGTTATLARVIDPQVAADADPVATIGPGTEIAFTLAEGDGAPIDLVVWKSASNELTTAAPAAPAAAPLNVVSVAGPSWGADADDDHVYHYVDTQGPDDDVDETLTITLSNLVANRAYRLRVVAGGSWSAVVGATPITGEGGAVDFQPTDTTYELAVEPTDQGLGEIDLRDLSLFDPTPDWRVLPLRRTIAYTPTSTSAGVHLSVNGETQEVPVDTEPTAAFNLVSMGIPGIAQTAHSAPVVVRALFPPVWTVAALRFDEPADRSDGGPIYATLAEGGDPADLASLAFLASAFATTDDRLSIEATEGGEQRLRFTGYFPSASGSTTVSAVRDDVGGSPRTADLAVAIHPLEGVARVGVLYHDPTSSPPSFYGLDSEGAFRTFGSVVVVASGEEFSADADAPLTAIAQARDLPFDEPTHVEVRAFGVGVTTADGAYISVVRPSRLTLAEPTVGAAGTYAARRDELLDALRTNDAVVVVRRDAL